MNIFKDDVKLKVRPTNKEVKAILQVVTDASVKCKCGHTVLIPPRNDKKVCTWCGEYVFRDKQAEFKYRLNSKLAK